MIMKLAAPTTCPVCAGEYEITKLTCENCDSELNGHFSGCDFCGLSDEDAFFVLTFLKCRGNIKDVEKELGISYPTVRGRLDVALKRLGLTDSGSQDDIQQQRSHILNQLDNGELDVAQATALLGSL